MALHFTRDEFNGRVAAARHALAEAGLDAILLFSQESLYYLTGFDSSGYVFFQCAVLTADERPIVLLTRRPDLEQAKRTSIIEDIRLWYDAEGADPAADLKGILAELGLAGRRVGVELATYGLTPANWERVRAALDGYCALSDASLLIRALRVVKSPAEIAYARRAAGLADDSLEAMIDRAGPGVFEGAINAVGVAAILAGGGELAASGPVFGSGERALLVRASAGTTSLGERDQLTMEFGAAYRRYHACLMRTVAIGAGDPRQERMFEVTRDALSAMTEAATPGRPLGEIDDAHRRVFDAAGLGAARMAACGYSLGATFRPTWMDVPPMLYSGNPMIARPGMVLFLHAILADAEHTLAMSLGHTIVVTESGREALTRHAPAYTICR